MFRTARTREEWKRWGDPGSKSAAHGARQARRTLLARLADSGRRSQMRRTWKATPTRTPASSTTGPPEFPELMAASIWTPSSCVEPCTYLHAARNAVGAHPQTAGVEMPCQRQQRRYRRVQVGARAHACPSASQVPREHQLLQLSISPELCWADRRTTRPAWSNIARHLPTPSAAGT